MNVGSIYNKVPTDPIVNGGTYTKTLENGTIVEGIIMGVERRKTNKGVEVDAALYTFARGNVPSAVREGTESFQGWTLVAAPTRGAADFIKGVHAPKGKSKGAGAEAGA